MEPSPRLGGGEVSDTQASLESDVVMLRNQVAMRQQKNSDLRLEIETLQNRYVAAHEELQATNEELQSTNEELFIINADHRDRISDLNELNDARAARAARLRL